MPILDAKFCDNAEAPLKGNKVYRCSRTKGLGLCVTAAGNKSFVFNYTSPDGRERRMVIGGFGAWTAAAAKARVAELRRGLDIGIDPMAERAATRAEPSLQKIWEWYAKEYLTKLGVASQRDISKSWASKIEPTLGRHTKVRDISRADIQCMVDKISHSAGPTAANRCHSYLRRMLNLAMADGLVVSNPAAAKILRNQEYGRERFLTKEEIARLMVAIDQRHGQLGAAAVKLLLLTGARKRELLAAKWQEFDLEAGTWNKPPSRTKQRRRHRVPLSEGAVIELKAIHALRLESDFVFPSTSEAGHLVDLKRVWASLCAEADISDCRIHDLRHSFASVIASKGGSLEGIGKLLGHTQVQTTNRYAHLFDSDLRDMANLVGQSLKA